MMFKIIEKENRYILYNLYTDALVTVYKGEGAVISELLKQKDFINFLRNEFVYTDPSINQNLLSKYLINKAKYSFGELMITDAITYKRNLRCVYCMQQNTFKNVEELSPNERVDIWEKIYNLTASDSISIAFFGGEPLLSDKFITEELEDAYQRGINIAKCTCITNGANINDNIIDLINKYEFAHLQITLDGLAATHDKRRVAKSNINCFDKIIENMGKLLLETKTNIIINTVLDRKNIKEYTSLVDFIGNKFPDYTHGKNARIIFNVGQECHPINKSKYTIENVADSSEYAISIYDCLDYLVENNYKINQPLPSPICINRKENDIIISPDGDIYKCISGMGNKEFLLMTKEELHDSPMLYHIRQACILEKKTNENCINCEYMLMCNGGCEYNAFNNGVKHECNKNYLENSIDRIICLIEKIQRADGELVEWNK